MLRRHLAASVARTASRRLGLGVVALGVSCLVFVAGWGACADGGGSRDVADTDDTAEADTPDSAEADTHVPDSAEADTREPDTDEPDTHGDTQVDAGPELPYEALSPAPIVADADFAAFFTLDRVARVELRVEAAEWAAMLQHMRDYAATDSAMRSGRYFRATFVYHRDDGSDEVVPDIGFRTRGNTTRTIPQDRDGIFHKAHFKLKFDATFDLVPGTAEYVARDERRFHGVKELDLKWSRDDDPSQIRELFAWETMRLAGVLAPRTTPVALTFVLGDAVVPFGLYLGLESIDKPFLTRRLGKDDNDGDLYKCLWLKEGPATLEPITNPRAVGVKDWTTNYRPAYDLQTNEAGATHARLEDLIATLDTAGGEALEAWLDASFDVEGFLRALAVNVLVGMPDDYWAMGNNYYLYFGAPRGRFIPWDYDHGLGGGWAGEPAWSHEGIADSDVLVWKNLNAAFGRPGTRHPLVDKLLARPRYRARYLTLLASLSDPTRGLFSDARWSALYAAQAPLYAPHLDNAADEGELMEDTGVEHAYFQRRLAAVRAQLEALYAAGAFRTEPR
jgi:hypothetical protein